MIHDLDKTIENILLAKMPSSVAVKFDQPVKNWTKTTEPILNLYLFDVRENNVLRAHHWQPASANGSGQPGKQRTPFRFDCHYLLTAWAKEIKDQHELLSKAAAVLLQFPTIPKEYLAGSLRPNENDPIPPLEIPARVGSHDKLTNPAELWSALDNQIRPAISYIVTIPINPWEEKEVAKPVRTKQLVYQQRNQPETAVLHTEVAGEIRSQNELPANLYVTFASKNWQYRADVAENGRYRLPAIIPDTYALAVWQPSDAQAARKLAEKTVVVPPAIQILALADTFQLQIGTAVHLEKLHLTPRKSGYIGQAALPGFTVEAISQRIPRSGLYFFGWEHDEEGKRKEPERVTAVIPAAGQPESSFTLVYQSPSPNMGNYDLPIELEISH